MLYYRGKTRLVKAEQIDTYDTIRIDGHVTVGTPGDWLVIDKYDSRHFCRPYIFDKLYERAPITVTVRVCEECPFLVAKFEQGLPGFYCKDPCLKETTRCVGLEHQDCSIRVRGSILITAE